MVDRISDKRANKNFELAWGLLSPVLLSSFLMARKGLPSTDKLCKLRLQFRRDFALSAASFPLSIGFYAKSSQYIVSNPFLALCLYLIGSFLHFPLGRIFAFWIWNRQIDQIDRGGLDPFSRQEIRSSKFHHEIHWAELRYEKLKESLGPQNKSFGMRVFPINSHLTSSGPPPLACGELTEVSDEDIAKFPLDSDSPRHHLVIGQTGSGKTTLILKMMHHALERNWQVVVLDLKGDLSDVKKFLSLAPVDRSFHFPSCRFDFWQGTKREVAERLISMIPENSEPFYLSRNISAIHAVVTRSKMETPKSVSEFLSRLRNPQNFISDISDFKLLTSKERGMTVGDQIANDFSSYLEPFRLSEEVRGESFSWASDWDLALFSLDSFQPSLLRLANVILTDFSLWIMSQVRKENRRPVLLIVDEASALRMTNVSILTPLMQRARSAKVSLVFASQTYTAFGEDMDEIVNSGAIRWLGKSSKIEDMVQASGTKSVIEAGYQSLDGEYSGVVSHREQKEFKIDPDFVRALPKFHWIVSSGDKVSHLFIPPIEN